MNEIEFELHTINYKNIAKVNDTNENEVTYFSIIGYYCKFHFLLCSSQNILHILVNVFIFLNIKFHAKVTTVSNLCIGDQIIDISTSGQNLYAVFKDIDKKTSIYKWGSIISESVCASKTS